MGKDLASDVFGIYDKGFLKIGAFYAGKFAQDTELVKGMVRFSSVRNILSEAYEVARKKGKCEDITKMTEPEKRELWAEAKLWLKEGTQADLHKVCKSIIVIGSLI